MSRRRNPDTIARAAMQLTPIGRRGAAKSRSRTVTEKIVFYHNPQSRAAIVHWMLEEVGADYEIRHIDFQKGDHKSPEFLAINPMGKIPTIVVGDTVITEAPAIIAWLADAYPEGRARPAAGFARARHLLPLAVLRRQLHRAGDGRRDVQAPAAGAEKRRRLGQLQRRDRHDRKSAAAGALPARRQILRRRRVHRSADDVGRDVRGAAAQGKRARSAPTSSAAPDGPHTCAPRRRRR